MKPQTTERSISIVGLGNWGSSLAHALQTAGVPLGEIILPGRRRRSGAAYGVWARGLPFSTLNRAELESDIVWLCVPDAAISTVAEELTLRAAARGATLKRKIVVHSSGALGAEVLRPAMLAGASVASVHPLMTFSTRKPVGLQGVPFGIEADGTSRRTLNQIVRRLGGRPFAIQAGSKPLYHAVGMLASPLLVSHLAAAQQVAALAGFNAREARKLIEPIVRVTLDNLFQRGASESFSGPIARGDLETIRLHLEALQLHPMLAGVYRSLALYALEVLPSYGTKELRILLRKTK